MRAGGTPVHRSPARGERARSRSYWPEDAAAAVAGASFHSPVTGRMRRPGPGRPARPSTDPVPVAASQNVATCTVQLPGVQGVVLGYVSSGHAGCGTSGRPVAVITPELPGPV